MLQRQQRGAKASSRPAASALASHRRRRRAAASSHVKKNVGCSASGLVMVGVRVENEWVTSPNELGGEGRVRGVGRVAAFCRVRCPMCRSDQLTKGALRATLSLLDYYIVAGQAYVMPPTVMGPGATRVLKAHLAFVHKIE